MIKVLVRTIAPSNLNIEKNVCRALGVGGVLVRPSTVVYPTSNTPSLEEVTRREQEGANRFK